jgi:hypothetical protein
MVEDAWKWDALKSDITFAPSASVHTYDTSDVAVATVNQTNERSYILRDSDGRIQAWDVTDAGSEFRLTEVSGEYAKAMEEVVTTTTIAKPNQIAVYHNGAGLTVHLPHAPTGTRSYKLECIVPQADLAAAATELTVPYWPVVLAATALELEDRNTNPTRTERYWIQYTDALGKAISQNSDEFDLVMVPV